MDPSIAFIDPHAELAATAPDQKRAIWPWLRWAVAIYGPVGAPIFCANGRILFAVGLGPKVTFDGQKDGARCLCRVYQRSTGLAPSVRTHKRSSRGHLGLRLDRPQRKGDKCNSDHPLSLQRQRPLATHCGPWRALPGSWHREAFAQEPRVVVLPDVGAFDAIV